MSKAHDLDHPFSWRSAESGWRRLFDLATIGGVLDLRPGDRVLDLGAGWGGASEWLARLGCQSIALDPGKERMQACAKRSHIDPRLPQRSLFSVVAVGEATPFLNESFNALICLHALHHIEGRSEAFREIFRILKPGAQAVFAEPGIHHGKSWEARLATKRSGELEGTLDPSIIYKEVIQAGFTSMEVLPFPYPKDAVLSYQGPKAFQKEWKKKRSAGWASWVVHDYRPLFVIRKAGERVRDSRWTDGLRGKIRVCAGAEALQTGQSLQKGQTLNLSLNVENCGLRPWRQDDPAGVGTVRVGVRWFSPEGRLLFEGPERADLPVALKPGDETHTKFSFKVPELPQGPVTLSLDLVSEYVAWFSDLGPDTESCQFSVVNAAG